MLRHRLIYLLATILITVPASPILDRILGRIRKPKDKLLTATQRRHLLLQHALETYYGMSLHVSPIIPSPPNRISNHHVSLPRFPKSKQTHNLIQIRQMFTHAYDSYMYHAYPAGEIKPLSCQGSSFDLVRLDGLTLMDALDTLILMNNATEFARATERLKLLGEWWKVDQNVSVFETNIRVIGGLLSAHQLALAHLGPVLLDDVWDGDKVRIGNTTTTTTTKHSTAVYWEYDGSLLDMAYQVGLRLLPAFRTKTGIPYGTINLIYGVPNGETPIASLAGAGTLTLEFELLSRLTGDERFGKAAKLATKALWLRRSDKNLFGKHIDTQTGKWTEVLSGIGSNSDSFLEYLVKQYMLFTEDFDWWILATSSYSGVFRDSRLGEWYADVDISSGIGGPHKRVFESLMAFYPGMQSLLGEIEPAARSLNSFFLVREYLGFLPERFNYASWSVDGSTESGAAIHPLRPELLESCYFLHRASKDISPDKSSSSGWLWAADLSLQKLSEAAHARCGYATLASLSPETTGSLNGETGGIQQLDDMPSFFLSETLKYLYLIFDDDNILHTDNDNEWIFTTEAHPIHYHPDVSNGNMMQNIFSLQEILSRRLSDLAPNVTISISRGVENWAESTRPEAYHDSLVEVALGSLEHRRKTINHNHDAVIVSLSGSENDVFQEAVNRENIAHLSATMGVGDGTYLQKSCVNFQSSSYLWHHALNGGFLQYASHYSSAATDQNPDSTTSHYTLLGSAEALGIYGSGTYVGHSSLASNDGTCTVPLKEERKVEPTQRVSQVHTNFGGFEISPYEQGGGFFLHHKDKGHTMLTSFLSGERDAVDGPMVMIYSSFAIEEESDETEPVTFARNVVVSDFKKNSFSCHVDLILKGTDDEVLETIPCAPGHFGPGQMNRLLESEGAVAVAPVYLPREEERFQCPVLVRQDLDMCISSDDKASLALQDLSQTVCREEPVIFMVERGGCSFFEKAVHVSKSNNSPGLVVVNTIDDELFIMSNTDEESDLDSLPLTVLITGSDGELLRRRIGEREQSGDQDIIVRIRLTKQPVLANEITAFDHCPIVSASENQLRIFTGEGWGVHASSNEQSEKNEWQIQLFSHSLGSAP